MDDAERLLALGGLENLRRAAELTWDDDPETLFRVASALWWEDETKECFRALRRLTEIVDEDFIFITDMLHLAGLIAREAGNDERAEQALRAAFEEAPESRGHGRWLAGLLVDHERYDEALDVVQVALEHRPGDVDLIGMRDWLIQER